MSYQHDSKEVAMKPEEETGTTGNKWERWQDERYFVRAVVGKYGEIYKSLYGQPRVYKSKEMEWKGGPSRFGKNVIYPDIAMIVQSL